MRILGRRSEIPDEVIAAFLDDSNETVDRREESAPDWLDLVMAQPATPDPMRRTWVDWLRVAGSVVLLAAALAVVVSFAALAISAAAGS